MKKINKEIFNYIVFGILTTLLNLLTYALLAKVFLFNYQFATVTAWIVSVLFAYYTNKKYVFEKEDFTTSNAIKNFFLFVYYRLLSLVVDLIVMYVLIEFLYISDLITKIIANIIVVIFNYITSKLFVFSKK